MVIVVLATTSYAFFLIKKDFNYRHQVFGLHPPPVNWISYELNLSMDKLVKSFIGDKIDTLPRVDILIPEKAKNTLLRDIPNSTKEWQKAYFLKEDRSLQKIKIKHKGDNPFNYVFDTKSWRVKFKKDQLMDGTRVYDYSISQSPLVTSDYLPLKIAKEIGILSPKSRLVELYINGKMSGVYIETEKLDELFLRNNNIMPVNLYKGERNNSGALLSIGDDLFNNPSLWSKQSVFNHYEKNDISDLKNFLLLLSSSETLYSDFEKLIERIDINIWAKFAAFQILVQSLHNDSNHNMRIVLDKWAGKVHIIPHDIGSDISDSDFFIDKSSNAIFSLLNQSSIFLDLKYKYLKLFLDKNILSKELKKIEKISQSIDNSFLKSSQLLQLSETNYIKYDIYFFNYFNFKERRKKFTLDAANLERNLLLKLNSKPRVVWSNNLDKKIKIIIDGEMPVSKISFKFKGQKPKSIFLDYNNNGFKDAVDIEVPFLENQENISLDLKLYANRVVIAESFSDFNSNNHNGQIHISPTEFNLILDCSCKIYQLSGSGIFLGKQYIFKKDNSSGVFAKLHNKPILSNKLINSNTITLKGPNVIDTTVVFDNRVIIEKGSIIKLYPGASLVFKKGVKMKGTEKDPIIFKRNDINTPWGTVAIQGPGSNNSTLSNVEFSGGSGGDVNNIRYTSMLSIHDVKNMHIKRIKLTDNSIYDDAMHLVYCKNINIEDIYIKNSFMDAIDIDMSDNIFITGARIESAGNDALDLMSSSVLLQKSSIRKSADKGVSIGERSNAVIHNTDIVKNSIGIGVKDASTVLLSDSLIENNTTNISAYLKNWRYNSGGNVILLKSNIGKNKISISKSSKLAFDKFSLDFFDESEYASKDLVYYDYNSLLNKTINDLLLRVDNN